MVDDLEEARKLCYGSDRHKVVSVDGTMFKPNGTFTGLYRQMACRHCFKQSLCAHAAAAESDGNSSQDEPHMHHAYPLHGDPQHKIGGVQFGRSARGPSLSVLHCANFAAVQRGPCMP